MVFSYFQGHESCVRVTIFKVKHFQDEHKWFLKERIIQQVHFCVALRYISVSCSVNSFALCLMVSFTGIQIFRCQHWIWLPSTLTCLGGASKGPEEKQKAICISSLPTLLEVAVGKRFRGMVWMDIIFSRDGDSIIIRVLACTPLCSQSLHKALFSELFGISFPP